MVQKISWSKHVNKDEILMKNESLKNIDNFINGASKQQKVLKKMTKERNLLFRIRKRQQKFLGHAKRKEG